MPQSPQNVLKLTNKLLQSTLQLQPRLSKLQSPPISPRPTQQITKPQPRPFSKKLTPYTKFSRKQTIGPRKYEQTDIFAFLHLPLTATTIFQTFKSYLTEYQQNQILQYDQIYYIGYKAYSIKHKLGLLFKKSCTTNLGEYSPIQGDHIAYRYEHLSTVGKGAFGIVIKVFDHKQKKNLAIKILNHTPGSDSQQGKVQSQILTKVQSPHILTIHDSFQFRGHFFIVTELLGLSLFEFLKEKKFKSLPQFLIKSVARQVFQALKSLRAQNIIHCDLKPENILFTQSTKNQVKIIDFGSACYQQTQIYTYIQSRFYRAPEVMLALEYSRAIDVWSLGCILIELFKGRPAFVGETEYEQFVYIAQVKGLPPRQLLQKGRRCRKFFDIETGLLAQSELARKRLPGSLPFKMFLKGADPSFIDFVESKFYVGCLEWVPEDRIKPEQALQHPWFSSKPIFLRSKSPNLF